MLIITIDSGDPEELLRIRNQWEKTINECPNGPIFINSKAIINPIVKKKGVGIRGKKN